MEVVALMRDQRLALKDSKAGILLASGCYSHSKKMLSVSALYGNEHYTVDVIPPS